MDQVFKAAGLAGRMPRPVRGKGRTNTFDLFSTAIQNIQPNEMPLLLLDSEYEIVSGKTVWQHLKVRDGFIKPNSASDEHAYLMAQVMETWLLADPDTLRAYFVSKFKADKIPVWKDLEAQPNLLFLRHLKMLPLNARSHTRKVKSRLKF
ncbi:MAG: hypothetical protein IPH31_17755 [Lewinellaceae bacterium]|nr:hypothetical protein [Lewinellaceae bacterium]